ncbi:hypothetical protein PISMIDRAFT_685106 [Pisolithus microcarpus 441]|uniref:Selenoprotein O n=1 Tax=Pisolithus microcarpus 441 TaxID=765257 RepID=A0A0C9ZCF8_9AGAM|nr:hypothetical protein PISMIDRAFT_685106 [Pisolithus microcarpus 441]
MDVFDPHHICNHSDQEGRYAYNQQPNMMPYKEAGPTTSATKLSLNGVQRESERSELR